MAHHFGSHYLGVGLIAEHFVFGRSCGSRFSRLGLGLRSLRSFRSRRSRGCGGRRLGRLGLGSGSRCLGSLRDFRSLDCRRGGLGGFCLGGRSFSLGRGSLSLGSFRSLGGLDRRRGGLGSFGLYLFLLHGRFSLSGLGRLGLSLRSLRGGSCGFRRLSLGHRSFGFGGFRSLGSLGRSVLYGLCRRLRLCGSRRYGVIVFVKLYLANDAGSVGDRGSRFTVR